MNGSHGSISRRNLRWTARLAITAMAAGILAAVQLSAAPAALAVPGLYIATGTSATNSGSPKYIHTECKPGDRVLGGGAWTSDDPSRHVALILVAPFHRIDNVEGYEVRAAETGAGTGNSWRIQAYALCAPDPSNSLDVTIERAQTTGPEDVKMAKVACPAGKVALGTGARVTVAVSGEVVLQLSRASGSGDISRAQARETTAGFSGNWGLVSYAICAKKPAGYHVVYAKSPQVKSQADKAAQANCPPGQQLLGAGGAINFAAPSHVSLSGITPVFLPEFGQAFVLVEAHENTETKKDWDFIVAQAICADP